MSKICRAIVRLSGLSLIAALMMTGGPAKLAAKELCWEECTFELMGGCWKWKKACLQFSVDDRGRAVAPESYDRSPSRQQIPSQIGSLLSGGGLSTALNLNDDDDDNDDAVARGDARPLYDAGNHPAQ